MFVFPWISFSLISWLYINLLITFEESEKKPEYLTDSSKKTNISELAVNSILYLAIIVFFILWIFFELVVTHGCDPMVYLQVGLSLSIISSLISWDFFSRSENCNLRKLSIASTIITFVAFFQ